MDLPEGGGEWGTRQDITLRASDLSAASSSASCSGVCTPPPAASVAASVAGAAFGAEAFAFAATRSEEAGTAATLPAPGGGVAAAADAAGPAPGGEPGDDMPLLLLLLLPDFKICGGSGEGPGDDASAFLFGAEKLGVPKTRVPNFQKTWFFY